MTIKLGIVGVGNMGTGHCRMVQDMADIELVAIADIDKRRTDKLVKKYDCAGFYSSTELIKSGICDSILIATPHYDHTTIGIAALKAGLHVLVEKPISAHKADCERLIKAHKDPALVFAAMFNQRTNRYYRQIKTMIEDGTLGAIRRFNWTITDWFRPQSYYDSGGWRATWGGEGGGVLLNQSPHQLDLLQWLFGMPGSIQAFCDFGKYHDIEVEDAVTARLIYGNGVEGVFTTTTGEAPGINRLEIAAENGLLVYDTAKQEISFSSNEISVPEAIRENAPFSKPKTTEIIFDDLGEGGQHASILKNFAASILRQDALIAPASEGIHSVELANAMLLSGASGKMIELPLSSRRYAAQLNKWIAGSRYQADAGNSADSVVHDISDSF